MWSGWPVTWTKRIGIIWWILWSRWSARVPIIQPGLRRPTFSTGCVGRWISRDWTVWLRRWFREMPIKRSVCSGEKCSVRIVYKCWRILLPKNCSNRWGWIQPRSLWWKPGICGWILSPVKNGFLCWPVWWLSTIRGNRGVPIPLWCSVFITGLSIHWIRYIPRNWVLRPIRNWTCGWFWKMWIPLSCQNSGKKSSCKSKPTRKRSIRFWPNRSGLPGMRWNGWMCLNWICSPGRSFRINIPWKNYGILFIFWRIAIKKKNDRHKPVNWSMSSKAGSGNTFIRIAPRFRCWVYWKAADATRSVLMDVICCKSLCTDWKIRCIKRAGWSWILFPAIMSVPWRITFIRISASTCF